MIFWGRLTMQDALSLTSEQILYFHDYLMMVIRIILCRVGYFLRFVLFRKTYSTRIVADHLVERVWTVLPIIVLVFLVYPSIYLLYLINFSRYWKARKGDDRAVRKRHRPNHYCPKQFMRITNWQQLEPQKKCRLSD